MPIFIYFINLINPLIYAGTWAEPGIIAKLSQSWGASPVEDKLRLILHFLSTHESLSFRFTWKLYISSVSISKLCQYKLGSHKIVDSKHKPRWAWHSVASACFEGFLTLFYIQYLSSLRGASSYHIWSWESDISDKNTDCQDIFHAL